MDRLVLIPVPSLLDNETIRDALLRDTGVQRAMALLASCTVALVGIGWMGTVPQTREAAISPIGAGEVRLTAAARRSRPRTLLPSTWDEEAELRNGGAAGEICARFFDIEGHPCVTSLDRRMVALDLTQLRAVPLVVAVASGKHKAAAILGAVRGGYVKSLVTDDVTAVEMMTLARQAKGVADVSEAMPIVRGRRSVRGAT